MIIRVFYERSNPEKPWTLSVEEERGIAHYPARKVHIHVPCWTEEYPQENTSQKYYIAANGFLTWDVDDVAHIGRT